MRSWWGRSQPPRRLKYTTTTPWVIASKVTVAAPCHCASANRCRSISRHHREIVEVHVAVGLGPQADASGYRLGEHVLQVRFAVEIGCDLRPDDVDLEVMPLPRRGRRVPNPLYRG